ncbi:MAG: DUF445 family protein [Legionellales bacterium]|nr:DUF445 family protein [Legionellales bacterium]
MNSMLNKSFLTNFISVLIAVLGLVFNQEYLKEIGYYALSGAITNWIAIFMLFEKVPFLYGSGVIPSRFREFKLGIKNLIMDQFFTTENIDRFFMESNVSESVAVNIQPLLESFDFEQIYHSLIDAIMESKFGSMLSMLGGREALIPLKEPIIERLKKVILHVAEGEPFKKAIATHISQVDAEKIRDKVEQIVERRLAELTPQMIKIIVQDMIRKHLGWLVVWGGVFGGLIGLVVSVFHL